jgi:hypothetical protein
VAAHAAIESLRSTRDATDAGVHAPQFMTHHLDGFTVRELKSWKVVVAAMVECENSPFPQPTANYA